MRRNWRVKEETGFELDTVTTYDTVLGEKPELMIELWMLGSCEAAVLLTYTAVPALRFNKITFTLLYF